MTHVDAPTLAYFAGVMDGEGCISIGRTTARPSVGLTTRYSVSLTVGNTGRELIKRGQAEVALALIHGFDSHQGARRGAFGGTRVGEAELARRAALYERIRKLNRVGNVAQLELSPDGKKSIGVTAEFRRVLGMPLFNLDRLDPIADLDPQDHVDS